MGRSGGPASAPPPWPAPPEPQDFVCVLALPDAPPDAFVYVLHRLSAILQHDTAEALYIRRQSSSTTDTPTPLAAEMDQGALLVHWFGGYVRRWARILTVRLCHLAALEPLMRCVGVASPEAFAAALTEELEATLGAIGAKGQAAVRLANTGLDHYQREHCPTVWQVEDTALQVMAKALWFGLVTDLVSYRRDYPSLPGPPAYPLLHRDLKLPAHHPAHGNLWDETEIHDILIAVLFHDFYQLPVLAPDDLPVPPLATGQFPFRSAVDNPRAVYHPRYRYPGIHFRDAMVGPDDNGPGRPDTKVSTKAP